MNLFGLSLRVFPPKLALFYSLVVIKNLGAGPRMCQFTTTESKVVLVCD